jgi:hypothetical protein
MVLSQLQDYLLIAAVPEWRKSLSREHGTKNYHSKIWHQVELLLKNIDSFGYSETLHQLPNSSKNCLSIGLHRWMCGLQCIQGSRRKSSLVSLSTGLNVYMIYVFSAEFSLTCGALFLASIAQRIQDWQKMCLQTVDVPCFMISMQIAQLSLMMLAGTQSIYLLKKSSILIQATAASLRV